MRGSLVVVVATTAVILSHSAVARQASAQPTPAPAPSAAPAAPAAAPAEASGPRGMLDMSFEELARVIYKIPKSTAVRIGPDRVEIRGIMRAKMDLVGEEGDYYLVRNISPEDPQSELHNAWLKRQQAEAYQVGLEQFMKDKYIITDFQESPQTYTSKLSFVRRDDGLPHDGRWQMSFDVADMNGDGLPDLVLPPARLGEAAPSVYFQQPDHTWKRAAARFPQSKDIKIDYGTVRVADFDGDGNLDIALASHESNVFVFYGNGKGDFSRYAVMPKVNPTLTSRSLAVADFNRDGRPDLVSMAEVDFDWATHSPQHSGQVNVMLNLPSGWKAENAVKLSEGQGDWLTTGDIDGGGWPSILLTSHRQGVRDLVWRNVGKGERFDNVDSLKMPYNSYTLANAFGPIDRRDVGDEVLCFEQFNPRIVEAPTQACVIYHFHDAKGKRVADPIPQVLVRKKVEFDTFKGVAIGDIDGDGRNDIAVVTNNGEVRIFLQLVDGTFFENTPPLKVDADIFDVRIADLYHDGKGEVIVMGSPIGGSQTGGGVWVFAPQATARTTAAESAK